jgi:hypothetical protein
MNFIEAKVAEHSASGIVIAHTAFASGVLDCVLAASELPAIGSTVTIGLRPDNLTIGSDAPILRLTVDFAENLGGFTQIHATAPNTSMLSILSHGRPSVARGDRLDVGLGSGRMYLFGPDGTAL